MDQNSSCIIIVFYLFIGKIIGEVGDILGKDIYKIGRDV